MYTIHCIVLLILIFLIRRFGQVFGTYFGTKPVLKTSNPEHIKMILGDLKTFPNESAIEFNDKYLQNSMVSFDFSLEFFLTNLFIFHLAIQKWYRLENGQISSNSLLYIEEIPKLARPFQ